MPYREMRDAPADEAAKGSSPAEPMLRIAFDETEAIPGQQLSLRLTVLVPTYMPEPPVWPSLEAPNLLVRLPEGSTTPTSERVGGATWSGITRHYRLSPMVPGDFEIPPQQVTVTFVDPETLETARATLSTEALAYSAVVPEGANGLDPLLAAETLEIAQEVEGDPQAMAPGDSVTRTVTARIEGTSPIFLPTLLPAVVIEGVAAYPDEPVLSESDDRGVVSGIRTESVVYVAEGGGSGVAPPVSIAWYVLGTGKIERASLEGFPISIDGPPAWSGEPGDWRVLGIAAVAGLLFLGLGWWLLRRLFPLARRWMRRRRAARLDSETHAYHILNSAIARKDHSHLHAALDDWSGKVIGTDPRRQPEVRSALAALGASRYGRERGDNAAGWRALRSALAHARRIPPRNPNIRGALPPLNPGVRPDRPYIQE